MREVAPLHLESIFSTRQHSCKEAAYSKTVISLCNFHQSRGVSLNHFDPFFPLLYIPEQFWDSENVFLDQERDTSYISELRPMTSSIRKWTSSYRIALCQKWTGFYKHCIQYFPKFLGGGITWSFKLGLFQRPVLGSRCNQLIRLPSRLGNCT